MTALTTDLSQPGCCTPATPGAERAYLTPEVNIYETPAGYVLQADLPGVSKDRVEITLEGNELTIEGRRAAAPATGAASLYRESVAADYRRVFELDPAIDTTRIQAQVEQGVLTLHLPKSAHVQPRKINVTDQVSGAKNPRPA